MAGKREEHTHERRTCVEPGKGNGNANLEPTVTPDLQHSRTPSAYERFLRVGYAFPTHTRAGAQAWHGGLGGSVHGARCLEDASSFGAVVSQPSHGGKHVRSGHFLTSPTLTPSPAVALVRNNIPTRAFSYSAFLASTSIIAWYSSSSMCDIFSNFYPAFRHDARRRSYRYPCTNRTLPHILDTNP